MSFSNISISKQFKTIEFFVLAIAVLVTVVTLVWLLTYSHYGMNLTDESFYLIWMSNPWIYSVSTTQFGFIYHPLHQLLHGDISLIRQANILIIFGFAWGLCIVFFRATLETCTQGSSWRSVPMLALAAVTATCALIYFTPYGWLATPSYNSLIFQALLLASIGLLLAEKTASKVSIIGWLLIGVGGWLAFMAKPTSAATLAVLISICLPLTNKLNFRLLGISIVTAIALLVASAWVIDGFIIVFFNRLKASVNIVRLLNTGHDMFRIDDALIDSKEQLFLVLASVISFGATCLIASKKKIRMPLGLGIALLFALISLLIISERFLLNVSELPAFPILLILAVPLSVGCFGFILMFSKISRIQWGLVLYFAVLPYVLAFGTNNNYWMQSSLGSLFWVLAGLVILMPIISNRDNNWRILLPAVMSGQLITVFLLQLSMEQPYLKQPKPLYQEPLRQYDNVVAIGTNESEVILPKYLADFYRNIKEMANQAGFRSGIPMIDMTGYSPGVLYAIGAKSIGQPWMLGRFSGRNNLAIFMLNRIPCTETVNAWLLVDPDPDNRMTISPAILNNFGINFEQDFGLAAELSMPPTSIAHHGMPTQKLQLWKPTRPNQDAIAACEKKRNPL